MSAREDAAMIYRPLAAFALLSLVNSVAFAATGDAPDLRGASVTIPYLELKQLWDSARAAEIQKAKAAEKPLAPILFSVQSARYSFKIPAELTQAEGRVVFEVNTYGEGWVVVPLLPAEVRLQSIGPDGTALVVRDGYYALLLQGAGKRAVTLDFSVRLSGATDSISSLRLGLQPALINEATISGVPADRTLLVEGATRAESGAGAAPLFRLSADQPLVASFSRHDRVVRQPVPVVWNADVQTLVASREGRLFCVARVLGSSLTGESSSMQLLLPAAVSMRNVESEDLERWDATKAESGDGRVVQVRWRGASRAARELVLDFELPQPAEDGEWALAAPQVKGAQAQRNTFFVVSAPGLEISGPAGSDLPGPAPVQVIAAALEGASFLPVVCPPNESTSSVTVRRLPLVQAAQATVDEAHYSMRIVADGSILNAGRLIVRHDRALPLRLVLPKGCELLSASVSGRDVSPVDRGEGVIEFTLPAAAPGKPTEIAFKYSAQGPKLAPVSGEIELVLPRSTLFTHAIVWEISLPGAYDLTAFEGNVEMAAATSVATEKDATIVRLKKDLCRAEEPRAALFYQKRTAKP